MTDYTKQIAEQLGAKVVGDLPADAGGGALGAARIAALVADLRSRAAAEHPAHHSVAMSKATYAKLKQLADAAREGGHAVTPADVAAALLERALGELDSL